MTTQTPDPDGAPAAAPDVDPDHYVIDRSDDDGVDPEPDRAHYARGYHAGVHPDTPDDADIVRSLPPDPTDEGGRDTPVGVFDGSDSYASDTGGADPQPDVARAARRPRHAGRPASVVGGDVTAATRASSADWPAEEGTS